MSAAVPFEVGHVYPPNIAFVSSDNRFKFRKLKKKTEGKARSATDRLSPNRFANVELELPGI